MERRNNILLKVLLWPFIYIGMLFCLMATIPYMLRRLVGLKLQVIFFKHPVLTEIFVMNKQSEKLVRLGSMRLGWSPGDCSGSVYL